MKLTPQSEDQAKTMKTILSLFDYTGNWSRPYKEAGYNVIRQDIKLGQDIFSDTIPAAVADHVEGNPVHGILAAVPCTDFAGSGARWWKEKENQPAYYEGKDVEFESTVEMSIFFVISVLFIVELFNPKWWVIENPVGRMHKLVPEVGKPKMYFNPTDFGHPYTKRTALYGNFNTNLPKTFTLNLFGSEMWARYGGKSERTKAARSVTPEGFARAFFEANR
jgi:hypothetical protein